MTCTIESPRGGRYSILRTEGATVAADFAAHIERIANHDPRPNAVLVDLVEARDLPPVNEIAPIAQAWRRFAAHCTGPIAIVVNGVSRIISARFALIAAGIENPAAIFPSRTEADRWLLRWADRAAAVRRE